MITHLRLENFRRHAETELYFTNDEQLILISGANGVGKSTIFEAVLFCLYGEGRNGRGRLDTLCKRGSEIEGTEVEVTFTVGDVEYRVQRRRDNGSTTAILWANDAALTEGSREVTSEITHILGMDAKGFRVATYAQQRELDGLASMRPYERAQMLSRLLRLDVITRAKDRARADFREQRNILGHLPDIDNLAELRQETEDLHARISSQRDAIAASEKAIADIDHKLEELDGIDDTYRAAVGAYAGAEATVIAATEDVTRLERELERVIVPEPLDAPQRSIDELRADIADIERMIAAAELRQTQQHERAALVKDLETAQRQIGRLVETLQNENAHDDPNELRNTLMKARERITTLETAIGEEQAAAAVDKAALERIGEQYEHAETIGDICPTCGQSVTDEFRSQHLHTLTSEREHIETSYSTHLAKIARLRHDRQEEVTHHNTLQSHLDDTLEAVHNANITEQQISALRHRVELYRRQLATLPEGEENLEDLYARRADVTVQLGLASQAKERAAVRASAMSRRQETLAAAERARERKIGAEKALSEATISQQLSDQYHSARELREARQGESELRNALEKTLASQEATLAGAVKERRRAEQTAAKRATIVAGAEVAQVASEVLERVEARWAQQIRPALEGTITEILARLSDGRFDAVSLDDNYNLTVRDAGAFRALTELSGGEIDLVALGMRLGLAAVVSEHHGAGGAGFLILDECFGSQDPQRREAIMTALRNLRSNYGQIFLISHVGGLEDAADTVVTVNWEPDTDTTTVTVDS